MLQDDTIKHLLQISTVKHFKSQEYICYEGQPGSEMYIILQGTVGVYVSGAVDTQTEVARLKAGDFFGEMAIFDDHPRSASCIALEDVICVTVQKDKLQQFIETCPAIAMKIFENLSIRIRRLNHALYKNKTALSAQHSTPFEIPAAFSSHFHVQQPHCDPSVIEPVSAPCPICGGDVTVVNLKRNLMTIKNQYWDGRIVYCECDPLWHNVWTCPHCQYSNFYNRFFQVSPFERDHIRQILREQHRPILAQHADLNTPFDRLVVHYLQAIHINQISGNDFLVGTLWLTLYWLFRDASDAAMIQYCAERSTAALSAALAAEEIPGEESQLRLQLSMAAMYAAMGAKTLATEFSSRVLSCQEPQLKKCAYDLIIHYRL